MNYTLSLFLFFSSFIYQILAFAVMTNQTEIPKNLLSAFNQHKNAICRLVMYDQNNHIQANCTAS